ncbi:MAG: transposase [Verrucomicrobiales bacterium]|nr:transposase [Verrucomicrobiales bacterium]
MKHKGWHSRDYLPHLDRAECVQFVTFRLYDSIPAALIEQWRGELGVLTNHCQLPTDDLRLLELHRRLAAYEDAGHGACFLRALKIATTVQSALIFFDPQRYRLLEWCIMPNHVHALVVTVSGQPMPDVIHSWKSYTAHACNRILRRGGDFWMADYFDRYIRTAQHLAFIRNYIRDNPVKAGLCHAAEEWPWSSAYGARASRPLAHCGRDARAP